jgi:hypothetical protein
LQFPIIRIIVLFPSSRPSDLLEVKMVKMAKMLPALLPTVLVYLLGHLLIPISRLVSNLQTCD